MNGETHSAHGTFRLCATVEGSCSKDVNYYDRGGYKRLALVTLKEGGGEITPHGEKHQPSRCC